MLPSVSEDAERRHAHRIWWAWMLALAAVCCVGAGWAIQYEHASQRERAEVRLQALSRFRAAQVESWLDSQMGLADFLDDSVLFSDLFTKWRDGGDEQARVALLGRAVDLRRSTGGVSALLLDAQGRVLAQEQGPAPVQAERELLQTLARALQAGTSMHSTIYQAAGEPTPIRMDVVIPMLRTGTPARFAVVLRFDPRQHLFPLLSLLQEGTESTESLLWRGVGDTVVNMSDTRLGQGTAGKVVEPIATSQLVLAQLLRGEVQAGRVAQWRDYQGIPVSGTIVPIQGSDLYLVTKTNTEEVLSAARAASLRIVLLTTLLLLLVGFASRAALQRQHLLRSARDQLRQRQRLEALGLLQAIANSTSDSIYAKDLQGRYIFCNLAAGAALGRTAEELIGKTNRDLFGPDDALELDRIDAKAQKEQLPSVLEHVCTARGEVDFLSSKGPLYDGNGTLIGILGVSHDVTEVRRAELALSESEAYSRSVVAVLSEGILVCDAQGIVLSCNPAAEKMLGVTQAQWQGQSLVAPGWTPLRADGSPMPPEEIPTAIVLGGGPAQHQVLLMTLSPAGEKTYFELSAVPVRRPDSDELMAVVTSFADVSQRVRNRELLESVVAERTGELRSANEALAASRDAAEGASRAKSVFLANMSHEIRTPLNAIIGLTHIMAAGATDEVQRGRLARIGDAGQHLLQVINDILDLSKVEADKLELEQIDFATEDLFSQAMAMVAQKARAKGLALRLESADMPERLRGDPTRLLQILINLLSNAVKFTQTGSVRLRANVASQDAEGVMVRFEVHDTGPGIAADVQPLLFNAFEQGDTSTTRLHGGTGLGLALTGKLARAMGGAAGVVSTVGVGSCFWVTLRLGSAGPAGNEAAPLTPHGGAVRQRDNAHDIRLRHHGCRVLLAEDNPVNREVAESLLESVGLVVEVAEDGAIALEMALATSYDLILMDMQMPVMDGLEAARAIRDARGDTVPIIAMTANAFAEDRAACLVAGMDDHLAKPVKPALLYEVVGRWLDGASSRDPHPSGWYRSGL